MSLPIVALVGKPNVGKSSLFNRICGQKLAIVHDSKGVTRDLLYSPVTLNEETHILLTDSPGYNQGDSALSQKMDGRVQQAWQDSDLVLMVCDGSEQPNSEDLQTAGDLRKAAKKAFLLVNKTDFGDEATASDFYQFGFPVFCVSAHSGYGIKPLLAAIAKLPGIIRPPTEEHSQEDSDNTSFVLLGKPNVGKSSLFNCLLGEERQLVDKMPGSTRDAVAWPLQRGKLKIRLCDTAGVRKKNRVNEELEKKAVASALGAAADADLVIYLLDAQQGLEIQDLRLLHLIQRMGRALVLAINKSDLLTKQQLTELKIDLKYELSSLNHIERLFVSAVQGRGVGQLLRSAAAIHKKAHGEWGKKQLHDVLTNAIAETPPPSHGGLRPQLRYVHQVGTNPPHLLIHGKRLDKIPPDYVRYLQRSFRDALHAGTLKISLKNDTNPYAQ